MKLPIYAFGLLIVAVVFSGCQRNANFNSPEGIAFGLIGLIVVLFLVLAKYSNVLRDEVDDYDQFNKNAEKLQVKQRNKLLNPALPFSLSKEIGRAHV